MVQTKVGQITAKTPQYHKTIVPASKKTVTQLHHQTIQQPKTCVSYCASVVKHFFNPDTLHLPKELWISLIFHILSMRNQTA